uniref:Uncharacterized protein n=1 Tax=viral metagenome TaxID=1070528 RepID=A0A6C0DRN1_9ZZZZ
MPFVKSARYNLWGQHAVEEVNGKFYKFTSSESGKTVYIPETDIAEYVEGFSVGGRRRSTRRSRHRRRSTRRN